MNVAKTDHSRVAALFDAARSGDRAALDELVVLLTPLLWQVARDQGLDVDQAGDVVQTTWLRLLGSFAEIRSPVALTGWLITVTKREAWRTGEKRQVERPLPELPERLVEASPAPEEGVLRDDQRARLWRAVDALPDGGLITVSTLAISLNGEGNKKASHLVRGPRYWHRHG